jgi:hypothetical protein
MRSRSPLNHNETLLARSFTQPGPNEHDLTENVGPEELRGIARFLTRTARKLEAAAENNQAGATQCLQTAFELTRRADREAEDGKPEAAAVADTGENTAESEQGRVYTLDCPRYGTLRVARVAMGMRTGPGGFLPALNARPHSPL